LLREIKVVPVKTGLNVPAAFTFSAAAQHLYLEKATGRDPRLSSGHGQEPSLRKDLQRRTQAASEAHLGSRFTPRSSQATPYLYVYVTRGQQGG
jgi:hypothetical protein